MRLFQSLLAAAAALTIAAPAASALADPAWGGPDRSYDHGYADHYGRHDPDRAEAYGYGDRHDNRFWRHRAFERERAAWRAEAWRRHEFWAHRHDAWR